MHFDLDDAVPLAGFTAPALDVEAEASGLVTARFCLGQFGEPVADGTEGAGIGGGVGSRRPSDGRLVDIDDFIQRVQAVDFVEGGCVRAGAHQRARQRFVERLDNQRRFAAARHARNGDKGAKRQIECHIFQVVAGGTVQDQMLAAAVSSLGGDIDAAVAGQVMAGQAVFMLHHFRRSALGDNLAAMDARTGAHVDKVVGGADGIFVMLDDDDGIADIAQTLQRCQQPVVIPLMQADGRFVQHIQNAGQSAADLAG